MSNKLIIEDAVYSDYRNTHYTSALIEKTRLLYFNCKLSRVEIDKAILQVIKHLVNKKIIFMFRYQLKFGTITGVTKDVVRIKEGFKKRRINIKNLQIYHETVFSLLSLYQ